MSSEKIKAGEAFVSLTVQDSQLVAGLQAASVKIKDYADVVSRYEDQMKVRISLDGKVLDSVSSKVTDYLKRMEKGISNWNKKCSAVLKKTFSSMLWTGGALAAATAPFAMFGDKWDKMSGRTGMSTEWLSQTAHAADLCGTSIDQVEASVKGMQLMMMQAGRGSAEIVAALNQVGLSYDQLKNRSPEQQFEAIRESLGRVGDPSERAALAMKLFGEAGRSLLPMIDASSSSMAEMRQEAVNLGLSMDTEASKAAAALTDELARNKAALLGLGIQVGEFLMPVIQTGLEMLRNAVLALQSLAAKLKPFIDILGVSRRTAVAFSLAITGIVGITYATSRAFEGYLHIVNIVIKTLGIAKSVILTVCSAQKWQEWWTKLCTAATKTWTAVTWACNAAMKALCAHPYIALITGIGLAVVGVVAWFTKWKKSAGEVSNSMAELRQANLKKYAEDNEALEKLKEMSTQGKLQGDQLAEAVKLAGQLKATYGDIGITIEDGVVKIKDMTEATRKMIELQNKSKLADLSAEIEEKRHNVSLNEKELNEERAKAGQQIRASESDVFIDYSGMTPKWVKKEKNGQLVNATGEEIQKAQDAKLLSGTYENSLGFQQDPEKYRSLINDVQNDKTSLDILQQQKGLLESAIQAAEQSPVTAPVMPGMNQKVADYIGQWEQDNRDSLDTAMADIRQGASEARASLQSELDRASELPPTDANKAYLAELQGQMDQINRIEQARIDQALTNSDEMKTINEANRDEEDRNKTELQKTIDKIDAETEVLRKSYTRQLEAYRAAGKSEDSFEIASMRAGLAELDTRRESRVREARSKAAQDKQAAPEEKPAEEATITAKEEAVLAAQAKVGEIQAKILQAQSEGNGKEAAKLAGELSSANTALAKAQREQAQEEFTLAQTAWQEANDRLAKARKEGNEEGIRTARLDLDKAGGTLSTAQSALAQWLEKSEDPIADVAGEIEEGMQLAAKATSEGTFNAWEAASLGQTDNEKKIAENSMQTVYYLRRLDQKAGRRNAACFA